MDSPKPIANHFFNFVRKEAGPLLGLLFALFLLCSRIFISRDVSFLSYFDNSNQFFPWFSFAARSISWNTLPLWDPYQYSGHSFIGEMQAGLFYPPNLLLLFVLKHAKTFSQQAYCIEAFSALSLFMGAVFSYWLFLVMGNRRSGAWLGALIFAFSGFTLHRSFGQICMANSVIWLPFAVAAYLSSLNSDNKFSTFFWTTLSGTGIGLSVLAGHYMGFMMSMSVIGFYCAAQSWRPLTQSKMSLGIKMYSVARPWFLFGAIAGVAILVSGIQLSPTIEYMSRALRWVNGLNPVHPGERIPYTVTGMVLHFTPSGLWELISPAFHHLNDPGADGFLYSGLLALTLACIAFRFLYKTSLHNKVMCWLLVFGCVYGLGGDSFLHAAYNLISPLPDPVRAAARMSCLTHLAISALAASTFSQMGNWTVPQAESLKFFARRGAWLAVSLSALCVLNWVIHPETNLQVMNSLVMTSYIAVAALLWLQWSLRPTFKQQQGLILVAAAALILSDSYYFLINGKVGGLQTMPPRSYHLPSLQYPPEVFRTHGAQLELLSDARVQYRILNKNIEELRNAGDVLGLKMSTGHGASMPIAYFQLLTDLGWDNPRIEDLLSVKYVLSSIAPANAEQSVLSVEKRSTPLPIFRIYHSYVLEDSATNARTLLKTEAHPYRKAVILTSKPDLPVETDANLAKVASSDEIQSIHEATDRVTLEINTSTSGILVVGEQNYPGWQVTRNGEPAQLLEADSFFRAVAVPQGQSEVIFRYRPRSFKVGLAMTLAGLLVLIGSGLASLLHYRSQKAFSVIT